MTSANVIEYRILNKKGVQVGSHRQNMMCSRCNDGLEKFTPASDFIIESYGYDEEEDLWEGDKTNLEIWLSKNKSEFTFKEFIKGDKIKVRKLGEGTILESEKTLWSRNYKIELITGEIVENINQNKVLPL